MNRRFSISLFLFWSLFFGPTVNALVSVGGYVPFGPSTQKETTGSRDTFSFSPMVSVNGVFATPFYGQLFLPELAFVFHNEDQDGYSKRTMLFLFDFGHQISQGLLLRYGLGTALTRINGEGGTVELLNGGVPDTYYQPNQSSTSWNTTVNLGLENAFDANYAVRFQTYWFSIFNGEARKASYSLNLVYYL